MNNFIFNKLVLCGLVLSSLNFGTLAFAQQENKTIMELKSLPSRSLVKKDGGNTEVQTLPTKNGLNSSNLDANIDENPPISVRKLGKFSDKSEASAVSRDQRVGNLPGYAIRRDVNTLEAQDNVLKIAKDPKRYSALELGRGDIVLARIAQDLIGYEEAISPVRAVITAGRYKGAWLIGNATMDKKTKNILVKFTSFRSQDLESPIEATVHSISGELGLKGEFKSNYWNYFWAEVLASGVSGYSNALTERKKGIFGYSEIVPTPQSAAHQAVASAAEKTSDKFAERAREAPEFTVVSGPTEVNVFITKAPTEF
jgi:hypothetical protein